MCEHHLRQLHVGKRAGEEVGQPHELGIFGDAVHTGCRERYLRSPQVDDAGLAAAHDLKQQPGEIERHTIVAIEQAARSLIQRSVTGDLPSLTSPMAIAAKDAARNILRSRLSDGFLPTSSASSILKRRSRVE